MFNLNNINEILKYNSYTRKRIFSNKFQYFNLIIGKLIVYAFLYLSIIKSIKSTQIEYHSRIMAICIILIVLLYCIFSYITKLQGLTSNISLLLFPVTYSDVYISINLLNFISLDTILQMVSILILPLIFYNNINGFINSLILLCVSELFSTIVVLFKYWFHVEKIIIKLLILLSIIIILICTVKMLNFALYINLLNKLSSWYIHDFKNIKQIFYDLMCVIFLAVLGFLLFLRIVKISKNS